MAATEKLKGACGGLVQLWERRQGCGQALAELRPAAHEEVCSRLHRRPRHDAAVADEGVRGGARLRGGRGEGASELAYSPSGYRSHN